MSLIKNSDQSVSVELKWNVEFEGIEPDELFDEITFPSSLFILHRKIEEQYKKLPWPPSLKNVTLLTQVCGGRGDIAAAAKTIAVMQSIAASFAFHWILSPNKYEPSTFLTSPLPGQLIIENLGSSTKLSEDEGILIVGPVKCAWGTSYIENLLGGKIHGPRFAFLENAEDPQEGQKSFLACMRARKEFSNYSSIHACLFPTKYGSTSSLGVPMGLREGTGIFIDKSRLEATRSRGYCCPSYLLEIEDPSLKEDILHATCGLEENLPDYEQHSFNSGYAHWSSSWGKFIDFSAIHEEKKHLTIVLNQVGEFEKCSTSEFKDKIFTTERLEFLQKWGYGTIIVKGAEKTPLLVRKGLQPDLRILTLIVRPSFHPADMRRLQLASERLLATGDNTAAEAWASRCKLYLYEDVSNLGCKDQFLKQQVEIATHISLELGEFLRVAGKKGNLSSEEREKMVLFLQNPSFSQHTLDFCSHITKHFSFQEVLEGAIKRMAWHHCIPDLLEEEVAALEDSFKNGMMDHFKTFSKEERKLTVNLSELSDRVYKKVMSNFNR